MNKDKQLAAIIGIVVVAIFLNGLRAKRELEEAQMTADCMQKVTDVFKDDDFFKPREAK